jgi:hypothetical protein
MVGKMLLCGVAVERSRRRRSIRDRISMDAVDGRQISSDGCKLMVDFVCER